MAEIVLTRVDSRLIHGQVMTKWVRQTNAERIVVVSDELSKDEFLMEVYLLAAPPGISVECYSRQDLMKFWEEERMGKGKVLLLFPDIQSVKEVTEAGIPLDEVQIGGLGGGPSRKVVFQNITLDERDATLLSELEGKGIRIIFQTIPEDAPRKLSDILQKFRK